MDYHETVSWFYVWKLALDSSLEKPFVMDVSKHSSSMKIRYIPLGTVLTYVNIMFSWYMFIAPYWGILLDVYQETLAWASHIQSIESSFFLLWTLDSVHEKLSMKKKSLSSVSSMTAHKNVWHSRSSRQIWRCSIPVRTIFKLFLWDANNDNAGN